VTAIPEGPEKEMFISFMRRILVWDPDVRATSYDLLHDPWQALEDEK
jgi:serine/threonine protein kinase